MPLIALICNNISIVVSIMMHIAFITSVTLFSNIHRDSNIFDEINLESLITIDNVEIVKEVPIKTQKIYTKNTNDTFTTIAPPPPQKYKIDPIALDNKIEDSVTELKEVSTIKQDKLESLLHSIHSKSSNIKNLPNVIRADKEQNNNEKSMHLNLVNHIKTKFMRNWSPPGFAQEEFIGTNIKIKINLGIEGELQNILIDKSIANLSKHNERFTILLNSMIRAIKMTTPIESLPKNQFDTWQTIQLNFIISDDM